LRAKELMILFVVTVLLKNIRYGCGAISEAIHPLTAGSDQNNHARTRGTYRLPPNAGTKIGMNRERRINRMLNGY
jgi:hypothetical protein